MNAEKEQKKLQTMLDMRELGYSDRAIGKKLGIDAWSVRGILEKYNEANNPKRPPLELKSSLAPSLTSHLLSESQLDRVEKLRKAADAYCLVMDEVFGTEEAGDNVFAAKADIESSLMWAVKAVSMEPKPHRGVFEWSVAQRVLRHPMTVEYSFGGMDRGGDTEIVTSNVMDD